MGATAGTQPTVVSRSLLGQDEAEDEADKNDNDDDTSEANEPSMAAASSVDPAMMAILQVSQRAPSC